MGKPKKRSKYLRYGAAKKRRFLWLTPHCWDILQQYATRHRTSVSEFVEDFVRHFASAPGIKPNHTNHTQQPHGISSPRTD
jgi:hypothetical protein